MSSWGCPHEIKGRCQKVGQRECDPGMKGCVLAGRFVFANADKNERLLKKSARQSDLVRSTPVASDHEILEE